MLSSLLLYLASGAVTGIIAGLLGVGGGIVIVPMLGMLFAWQQFPPDQIQHMALGTSFGAIIFTSISSFMAHNRRGAVRWDIWKGVTPGILIGHLRRELDRGRSVHGNAQGLFRLFSRGRGAADVA